MRPIILIPARLNSTRLPGKALADIGGRPMIAHTLARALEADIGPVAVATDSAEIARVVETHGGSAVMTTADHPCGTDRIGEALRMLDPDASHDVVVNLQGDEPFLSPGAIRAALALLEDRSVDMGTLATLAEPQEADDPNAVKLIGAMIAPTRLRAFYFTRARAPWGEGPLYRHIGLYAYRRPAFQRYVSLPQSVLEKREQLEQLRAVEDGMRIDAALLDKSPLSVDTGQSLKAARSAAIHQDGM